MATLRVSASVSSGVRVSCSARPVLPSRRSVRSVVVRAQAPKDEHIGFELGKVAALSTVAGQLMMAGHASAATEIAQMAAADNRFGIIATLFVPVVGWVLFNILQPAQNQLAKMAEEGPTKKGRGVAAAIGLGAAASMLMAEQADAASEVAQLAAGDSRFSIIATLFVPVVGWVLFNILQPAQNQLAKMTEEVDVPAKKRRGVAAAIGLGAAASMLLVEQADAASEIAQLAAGDNRFGTIATLFVPVVGWVLFNILQPAQSQLAKMAEEVDVPVQKRRGVGAAVGLGAAASMLLAEQADAATEIAQLAASDQRFGIIATLFVPVVGWVLFNILQPALNQLGKMNEELPASAPVKTAARKITKKLGKK